MSERNHKINPLQIDSEKDFGVFYETYYERFVRYAYYYINNSESAQDITQDALLYYWSNKERLPEDTDVLGYILQTVKNKCLNHLNHLQIENEYNKKCTDLYDWEITSRIETLEEKSYDRIFSKEIMKIVRTSLSELPKTTEEIFIMNRFENMSRKDIAIKLNVSQQKVDYHINKANSYLRIKLKDYLPLIILMLI